MLGSLLCLPGSSSVLLDPYGSTISETTSEAWSVEVLPSDSELFTLCIYATGISATSEDIPNKIEDLRSECSSDFGGKDSVTSPDGEESGHGSSTGTIVRPKVHYARPTHPPPDPPIPEAHAIGHDIRHSICMAQCLAQAELEQSKQRHSFPDRLVRSRSSDIVCPGRRPTSDPGLNRRVAVEERDPPGAFASGPSSSPSKDSLKGEVTTFMVMFC
ncbi:hypothetical protein XENOCAPTIV_006278 [Xenoophorus captivus]|uniref:Uncharacterized protein n=1 Tax=Xenoophorus captivus TaxID=1517983 RepID=A0ABV0RP52_9TELE